MKWYHCMTCFFAGLFNSKHTQYIALTVIILTTLSGCNNLGNKDNPLFGKAYNNTSEIPEFKGYLEIGGSVIESSKDKEGNYKLGYTYLHKDNTYILILEEISKPNENGDVEYKILDAIYIKNVKEDQFLTNGCKQGDEWSDEVTALVVITDEESGATKILKAWLADTKTGTLKQLTDTKGITCIVDEEYEECGDEEYEEIEVPANPDDTIAPRVESDTAINQMADTLHVSE